MFEHLQWRAAERLYSSDKLDSISFPKLELEIFVRILCKELVVYSEFLAGFRHLRVDRALTIRSK